VCVREKEIETERERQTEIDSLLRSHSVTFAPIRNFKDAKTQFFPFLLVYNTKLHPFPD